MPERRAYADIVGEFRRGQAGSYAAAADYDRASRTVAGADPALAESYMGMADRARQRQDRDEASAYGRDYAGALHRGDYEGAGAAAARYGDPDGVSGARTARTQADEQQRMEVFRGMQRTLGDLERFDQTQGQGYEEWRARAQQALQQNPNMDPRLAEIARSLPPQWNPNVSRGLSVQFQRMLEENLTAQQIATLQNQRETRENQDWSMDAYGRPYRNNGGFIERRNEAGEIVRDEAPVPMPRDRVPLPATYGESGLNAEGVRAEREYARDWRGVFEDFSSIRSEFGRIEQMASRRDSAGDLALVVSFTKMLDPGSVAREGEVALTQSAASTLAQVTNFLPRLQQGNTLLPDQVRNQLLEAARQMYGVYEGAYNRLGEDYQQTAQQYGFDPSRVMRGWEPPQRGALGGRNDAWIANEGGRRPSQTPANPGVGLQSMTDEQLDALERELQNAGR